LTAPGRRPWRWLFCRAGPAASESKPESESNTF
jgi:hypothetical protein